MYFFGTRLIFKSPHSLNYQFERRVFDDGEGIFEQSFDDKKDIFEEVFNYSEDIFERVFDDIQ